MLTREDILNAFAALSDELERRGVTGEVILVGGALQVLVYGTRPSTKDVDAIALSPPTTVRSAVAVVASTLGLPADWLNDRARAFAPEVSVGSVVFETRALVVRLASKEQLLAMKISAMRDSVDYADARPLLADLDGTRDDIWRRLEPFLDPGQLDWTRQNFDALWKDVHGHP